MIEVLLDSVLDSVSSNKIVECSKKNKKRKKRKTSNKEAKRFRGRDLKLDGLKDCVVCKMVKTDHIMGVCEVCKVFHYPLWKAADWHGMKEIEKEARNRQKLIQKNKA